MRKKIIPICILIILMIMPFSYAEELSIDTPATTLSNDFVSEKGYRVIIEDDANLLTENEEKELISKMTKLAEYGNIALKTISVNPLATTESYAAKYYHDNFGSESGSVFLIDMDERYIYIFSDGENYKTITSAKANTITDNVYKYASSKQYYTCVNEAFTEMQTILDGGKIAEPMKYISNAVLAIMLGLYVNFIIFKMATNNRKASNTELVKECETIFKHTPPSAIQTGEHREYSPVQSSSSGGSSGGGGGGGHSSGGGGGHRF